MCSKQKYDGKEGRAKREAFVLIRGSGAGSLRLPTQDWFAGGADFIEATDSRGVRGGLDKFGSRSGLVGDRTHGIDEEVALFAGFRLRWLDHERAGSN